MGRLCPLSYISSLAKAGALERAWHLFEESGYLDLQCDSAALAVKGRLLAERAFRSSGETQRVVFGEAAHAFDCADRIQGAPWLRNNVATYSLLSGDIEGAQKCAREVLDRLSNQDNFAETAYHVAATRAESSLIVGDLDCAERAMRDAANYSCENFEDRAGTLKRLSRICLALGAKQEWLEPFRPPSSVHFVGHMGFLSGKDAEHALAGDVEAFLTRQRVGFAYGALAAGADLIFAERALDFGAKLHVILPTAVDIFGRQSVEVFGQDWLRRFESALARAASVVTLTRVAGLHDASATQLAGEVGMGSAILNAKLLAGRASQYVVFDEKGGGAHTANLALRWPKENWDQHVYVAKRDGRKTYARDPIAVLPDRECLATLNIKLDANGFSAEDEIFLVEEIENIIIKCVELHPPLHYISHDGGWKLSYITPAEAVIAGSEIKSLAEIAGVFFSIRGDYGVVQWNIDNISGAMNSYKLGKSISSLGYERFGSPDTFVVDQSFVAALAVDQTIHFSVEPIDYQDPDEESLFALTSIR